jgi:NSS family neurotransmitter:Na+ symporter
VSGGGREHWGSSIGFVLAAAGSAVGLGNIWRFPYYTGENGGAAFVLVYILCVLLLGFPLMFAELCLGRHTQKNAVGAFASVKPNSPWFLAGSLGVLAGFLILSYYSVVAGWTIGYFVESVFGVFRSFKGATEVSGYFKAFSANPLKAIGYHALFMVLCMVIVIRGVKSGIERWSKVLMPTLFGILVLSIVRALTLPGSFAGLKFLLYPDFSRFSLDTVFLAMGQAFYSLSLGMGCMITYGSYLQRKTNIPANGLWIAGLDLMVALLAGFAIFPAVFAFGLKPTEGAGLVFQTLPNIFCVMPAGVICGPLFFLLLVIAALTSGISLLEVVTAYFIDEKGWSRRKTVLISGSVIFLLGIPSALSFGKMAKPIVFGRTPFDFVDKLTANYILPFGSILIAIFVGYVWGRDKATREVMKGTPGFKLAPLWLFLLRYFCPVVVAQILIFGFLSEFTSERMKSLTGTLQWYFILIDLALFAVVIGWTVYFFISGRKKEYAHG